MSVLVHSANLGAFDIPPMHAPQQGVVVEDKLFTDTDFPPRPKAMTRRLQSKIPKCFGWDLIRGHSAYLWLDASLTLSRPDAVQWFLDQLGPNDFAVFRHPERHTIHEEAEFLRDHAKNSYIMSRYDGEDLIGQMTAILANPFYRDDHFFAAGAFAYRPTQKATDALTEWWVHTSRFHCIDQLAFPYILRKCAVSVIDEDIFHASHLAWTRKKGHG
jgi:hypothetical protein